MPSDLVGKETLFCEFQSHDVLLPSSEEFFQDGLVRDLLDSLHNTAEGAI